ncbi:MAG TPA: class I SAM-dependent methyltransferase [Steroidobacteraceae bacterium]|nr:class I SAM-dependent methyltransferase [Steroidobacteraceae bacterium]
MDGVLAQERVREHWDRQPCDSELSAREPASRDFYLDVERQRYALQPHILECHAWIDWRGKRVLEVGAGIGTDARQLIGAGARYTGINIDRGSAEATGHALRVFALPGVSLQRDARSLDFPAGAFDVVYSFGVLQHIPEVGRAVAEIERVLAPGGELLVMLYNRSSINYALEIMLLRKLGLRLLGIPGMIGLLARLGLPRAKLERHRQLHRERARIPPEEWLGRNTNGPDYPYCRVYGAREAEKLLSAFEIVRHEVRFFDHRHWGVLGRLLPPRLRRALGRRWGWHRILHGRKPATPRLPAGVEARS